MYMEEKYHIHVIIYKRRISKLLSVYQFIWLDYCEIMSITYMYLIYPCQHIAFRCFPVLVEYLLHCFNIVAGTLSKLGISLNSLRLIFLDYLTCNYCFCYFSKANFKMFSTLCTVWGHSTQFVLKEAEASSFIVVKLPLKVSEVLYKNFDDLHV